MLRPAWVVKPMPEEIDKVGNVSQSRYEQIVSELRDVVEQQTRGQFRSCVRTHDL